ncbi:hypothetical protein EJ110_NYTH21812 [Nymphaea thermarum]|nr:hypothetical protein EJ110_NYTH21812 [Nymphaea thermarum]
MKKTDERKASKSPGFLSKKKPEEGKTSKLPSSLEVKTSKEGKTSKSSDKSEESNTSRGSSSRDSNEDEKQESKVHETSRSSKKRDDKAGGETAKATSGCKLGTTSKRLDARSYRAFFSSKPFTSKPKEQKKEGDPGQSSHMIRDGCNETVACDEVKSANVGHGNMDHGDSYVKGDEENGNFCRLRSGKSIVKSIPVTENSLQNDSESAELEAGINNAKGDPHPSVSEESYVLSKHCKGWASNSQEVIDFSQSPFTCRDQDSPRDNIFSGNSLCPVSVCMFHYLFQE